MHALPCPWPRWVTFLARREAGTSLALFRIACGLGVLLSVGSVALHGLVPVIWLSSKDGGYRELTDAPWLLDQLGGITPLNVWAVVGSALLSGLLLVLGLGGRLPALVALQACMALADVNPQTGGSDDLMLANSLWLLVLSRSTATLSLDCRLRSGRWTSGEPVPAWPRYLAIYQLVLTYWATGVQKVGIQWTPAGDYSALYYILQIPSWQRRDMTWLAWVYPLTQVATAVAWLWENAAPLLLLALWYRATPERPGWLRACANRVGFRRLYVAVGLCMHGSLAVLMNVEPFNWVTLSYYVCLFGPEEWQAAWRRLSGGWEALPSGGEEAHSVQDPAWLAQGRAVLVGLHLLAVTLLAFPAPGARVVDRSNWKAPDAQEDLAAWADRLGRVGVVITKEDLEERLWALAVAYRDVHQTLTSPFRPYYDYCGTYQSWRMFGSPNRRPTRLHVEVEELGRWRPVYVERDPEHDWLGGWLDHSRFRPVLFRLGLNDEDEVFVELAAWLARQAARDFPRAERVRVRYWQFRTPAPAEVRAGMQAEGHFRPAVVLDVGPA
jgi:hypothetical protein